MTNTEVPTIGDDLTIRIGPATARLTPSEGLDFSEELARKSFRRALAEEAMELRQPGAEERN